MLMIELKALDEDQSIDEDFAVRVATNEVVIPDSEERGYRVESVEKENFGYRIFLQFYPLMPGGHCFVEVGYDGSVLRYVRGK